MSVKFYNPGRKITETLRFDHPTNDARHQNNISYYNLVAPEEDFFEVPSTLTITLEGGNEVTVPVGFAQNIRRDYAKLGVVMIDPRKKPDQIEENDNVAVNEKQAKEKAQRLYRDSLMTIAREHITSVEYARSLGGAPMRAMGNTAYALKALGITDPADLVGAAVQKTEDSDLRKQVAELTALVSKLTEGKKAGA